MLESETKSHQQTVGEAEVEDFRKALGPFVVAAETTRMPMLFTDAKNAGNHIVFANDAFLELTGYDRKDVLGQSFNDLMVRGGESKTLAQVVAAFDGSLKHDPVIHCRRKDSSEFWASIYVSRVCNEAGAVLQHFVSLIDLTKHIEDKAHADMLIGELNHRVKNSLQAVQSIVSNALRSSSDTAVVRESIESRIQALSRSHDLLMSEDWGGAGLVGLIKAAIEPFGPATGKADRLVIKGEDIHLTPRATLALGVAFHELAGNAMKYGALSNAEGSILVAWVIAPMPDGDRLVLRWQERDGPPVTPRMREGFGSRVIERRLGRELAGKVTLEFPPEGVVCTLDVPVPRRQEAMA